VETIRLASRAAPPPRAARAQGRQEPRRIAFGRIEQPIGVVPRPRRDLLVVVERENLSTSRGFELAAPQAASMRRSGRVPARCFPRRNSGLLVGGTRSAPEEVRSVSVAASAIMDSMERKQRGGDQKHSPDRANGVTASKLAGLAAGRPPTTLASFDPPFNSTKNFLRVPLARFRPPAAARDLTRPYPLTADPWRKRDPRRRPRRGQGYAGRNCGRL
jgi:hypothetical protein